MINAIGKGISFKGAAIVIGSEEEVEQIKKMAKDVGKYYDNQGFTLESGPTKNWIITTGEGDSEKLAKMRSTAQEIFHYSNTKYEEGRFRASINHDALRYYQSNYEQFLGKLQTIKASDVIEAVKKGSFDFARFAIKK